MSLNLKIFLLILILVSLVILLKTIKTKKISMKYGLFWTIMYFVLAFLIIFPNIIERLSTFLGFKEAPNMLFLIAIFLLFYIVFNIYANISKLNENNKVVIQELAIFEYERKNKQK